ncbi:protein DpdD [Gordonia sp. CPCC 205515]|uniref:protein DpdD n=1 Tax=Gordonia sp. CPCC 205515 TaxID=3140791 RepID=UPI003AF38A18
MNQLIEDFFGARNELARASLSTEEQAQLNNWIRALLTGTQTAFLPRSWQGRLFWYVFTPRDRRANEILELLGAWIGPTYSDVSRTRGRLDLTDPFDTRIDSASEFAVHRFEVLPRSGSPTTKDARTFVRQALVRLTELLDHRPESEFRFARTTADILDDLGHALSTRDRAAAEIALNELSTNGDLDATNMSFVRIRALAALGDWQEILADRAINDVLRMNRPPGVTRSIRRAVYHTYLAALDRNERDIELLSATEVLPNPYRSIAKGPTPRYRDELVLQVLLALRSDAPNATTAIERLIMGADEIEVGLESRLRRLVAASTADSQTSAAQVDPASMAVELYDAGDARGALQAVLILPLTTKTGRIAVSAAADLEDEQLARTALDYVNRDPEVRARLASIKSIQRNLDALDELGDTGAPHDWASWFDMVAQGTDLATVSAHTPDDFERWAPLDLADLSARLDTLNDDALMILGEASGQFLAAHREVLEVSGATGGNVGRRLIEALAVGSKCSSGIQTQALNLVELAFAASHTPSEYRELIENIGEIRRTNAAPSTTEWQVDLLQLVTSYPHPDQNSSALIQFIVSCLNDLTKYRLSLSFTSITAVKMVADEAGIALPPEFFADSANEEEDELNAYSYLTGKRVALYSLMGSAIRRAASVLRQLVPGIDVRLYSDSVGSPSLAKASENVDIFVIVTAAAKHAATEFIEANRGKGPIVRVNSKGTSAILRELRGNSGNSG